MLNAVFGRVMKRWPQVAVVLFVSLIKVEDVLGQTLNLDGAIDQSGSEIRRYVGKGLELFGLVVVAIGLAMAGFKFSKKDHEAVWYVAGAAAGAALFIGAKTYIG
jgi:hypothetical protein